MTIRIGCDPELFAIDINTKKAVSVHDLIPGDKLLPYPVPHGAIQVDGTAAEFNIDPAENHVDFIRNIKRVSGVLELALKAKNANLILVAQPSVVFDKEYFEELPWMAKELGCEPDYNAYTGQANKKPDGDATTMRTGSGHIHIGWTSVEDKYDKEHFEKCCSLVKELDATLNDVSICWDTDTKRQELYGKPGAFRPKTYGLEYRVLSNAWLNSEDTMKYVFDTAYYTTMRWLEGVSCRAVINQNSKYPRERFNFALRAAGIPCIEDYLGEGVISYVRCG